MDREPLTHFTIRGGSDNATVGGQATKLLKLIYKYTTSRDVDIALMKTERKLKFNPSLKQIGLGKARPKVDSVAMLSGFGKTEVKRKF